MSKSFSIAEARHNLAALVHELEHKPFIELTRRGKSVAILLSLREYHRLQSGTTRFWDAYTAFRDTVDLDSVQIEADTWREVRDTSTGREVEL